MHGPDEEAVLTRIRAVAAVTFNCPEESIGPETTAADVNGWDSLSHTHFLVAIERHFAVRLDVVRVVRLETVGDLAREIARILQ